jgi:hypothetical protein
MQLELELLCDFEELCANAVGKVLSPNTIEVDDDGRHGHVAYVLAEGSPPLETLDGRHIRAVILQYELEDVDHEQRH